MTITDLTAGTEATPSSLELMLTLLDAEVSAPCSIVLLPRGGDSISGMRLGEAVCAWCGTTSWPDVTLTTNAVLWAQSHADECFDLGTTWSLVVAP